MSQSTICQHHHRPLSEQILRTDINIILLLFYFQELNNLYATNSYVNETVEMRRNGKMKANDMKSTQKYI